MIEEKNRASIERTAHAAFIINGFCATAAGVLVNILQQRYQLPYTLVGTLLAALSLGNLLASLLSGLLAGRLGTRGVVLLFSGGAAIGYGMMVLSGKAALLWLAFFLVGIAKGGTVNSCNVLMGLAARDRTRSMNLMNAGFALGALSCPFIVRFMSGGTLPWQAAFWTMAVLGLVNWLCFALAPIARDLGKSSGSRASEWGFLRTGRFWMLTGVMFFQQASEVTVTSMAVTYFQGTGLLSASASGFVITLVWLCMLLGRLIIAHYAVRVRSPFALLSWMGVGCLLSFGLMLVTHSTALALLGMALYGLSVAGVFPTTIAAAGSQLSNQSMGVILPVAGIGAVVMPAICGRVAEAAGLRVGMSCVLAAIVGLIVMSALCRRFIPCEESA